MKVFIWPFVALYLLIGCTKQTAIEDIGFLTHVSGKPYPLALGRGTVIIKGKCIYIESNGYTALPVWPDFITLKEREGGIVLEGGSRLVIELGDSIKFAAGYNKGKTYLDGIGVDYSNANHCNFSHIVYVGDDITVGNIN